VDSRNYRCRALPDRRGLDRPGDGRTARVGDERPWSVCGSWCRCDRDRLGNAHVGKECPEEPTDENGLTSRRSAIKTSNATLTSPMHPPPSPAPALWKPPAPHWGWRCFGAMDADTSERLMEYRDGFFGLILVGRGSKWRRHRIPLQIQFRVPGANLARGGRPRWFLEHTDTGVVPRTDRYFEMCLRMCLRMGLRDGCLCITDRGWAVQADGSSLPMSGCDDEAAGSR